MNIEPNHVAVFHRDQLNRNAIIKLLNDEFDCLEIERWEDVVNVKARTIVLLSPELLYPKISFDSIKEVIANLDANVLMVNYDDRRWWIFRSAYLQLKRPSEEQFRKGLRTFESSKKPRRVLFKNWIRA